MRYNNRYNKYNNSNPHGSGDPYDRNVQYCVPTFPDYPSLNSAIEHFKVMKIIARWGPPGVPPVKFLDHMELQLKKFKGQKDVHKEKVQRIRTMLDKFDHITSRVIKDTIVKNIDNPAFNEAISTKKRADGVEVGNYIIQVTKKKYKSYNIINKLNQNILYTEIRLYETAYMIVKTLINGANKDSEEIEQLLDENEHYNGIAKNIWFESLKLRDRSLSEEEKGMATQTINQLEEELLDIKTHIKGNYNEEINSSDV
jgi:NADH dehydrogenase/NADH:ubiquinone oxidoreductase subunit G